MSFNAGDLGHILSVLFFIGLMAIGLKVSHYYHTHYTHHKDIKFFGVASTLFWVYMQIWYLSPQNFDPFYSFPLHICDLALPLAILTLFTSHTWLESTLYYWAIVFTSQAFITPVSNLGPNHIRYWLFWISHSIIIYSAFYIVCLRKFRPTFHHMIKALIVTCLYGLIILPINLIHNWNYGYIGNVNPETPTMIDLLGPWPLRLLWLLCITILCFSLATLPFMIHKRALFKQNRD